MQRNNEDFIHSWTMPEEICDNIVNFYNTHPDEWVKGAYTNSENIMGDSKDIKDSNDLIISPRNNDKPFYDYKVALQKCLDEYIQMFPMINNLCSFGICEAYNIQHYPKGGGFKVEHFERDGSLTGTLKRCLVFLTYLNDVENGGTIFKYQNRTIKAQKGKTILFPPDWTHTHVGQISQTQEKMIVTGWYSFMWDF